MSEDLGSCSSGMPVPEPASPSRFKPPYLTLGVAVVGLILLVLAAVLDESQKAPVWENAVLLRNPAQPWDGATAVLERSLPIELFPSQQAWSETFDAVPQGSAFARILREDMLERLISVDLPDEIWTALVSDGRAPRPGQNEVLAGPLARLDWFEIDGVAFSVVGRTPWSLSALTYTYLVPAHPGMAQLFPSTETNEKTWLDPEGIARIRSGDTEWPEQAAVYAHMTLAPASESAVILASIGLFLVACGGGTTVLCLLRRLAGRVPLLNPFLDALRAHARLVIASHLLYFGAFFALMLLAIPYPFAYRALTTWVAGEFAEGSHAHIGAPYMAGDILGAAWQTFRNNFLVVTCSFVILPAVVFPMVGSITGLMIGLLPVALAGFAMAPLSAQVLGLLTYHSVTVALELEAYALAGFLILVYPVTLIKGLFSPKPMRALLNALGMAAGGTVIVGMLLALAALYEAVTLILLG